MITVVEQFYFFICLIGGKLKISRRKVSHGEMLFLLFMESPDCPTFIKAEIETVKKRPDKSNKDDDGECITDDETDQPDWIRAMRPTSECIGDTDELEFDDGGPSRKWDVPKRNYPSDFGKEFVQNLSKIQIPDSS